MKLRVRGPRRWADLSLRGRLTVFAAAAVAIAVVAVASSSWFIIRGRLYQDLDAQLASSVQLAARSTNATDALDSLLSVNPPNAKSSPGPPGSLVVQFLDSNGRVRSAATTGDQTPALPVTAGARAVAAGTPTSDVETVPVKDRRYRVWTVAVDGGAVALGSNTGGIEEALGELAAINAVVAVIGTLLAALVGWLVARAALRPVDSLIHAVERVSSTQDLTGSIDVRGDGEIGQLVIAFNGMLAALTSSRTAQRRLVEDAGHELRTPLTSIRNNIELLIYASGTDSGRTLPEQDREQLLADVGEQTVELTTMIDELIELAKEDAVPEPFDQVDLADVVQAAVDRARLGTWPVRFELDCAAAPVLGRRVSLERAVCNLLYNAAKWSPAGGLVRAEVRRAGPWASLTVSDDGPGIAEIDRPHVFERFYRADTARALPGSGLGLAIVEQVVSIHHGTADVDRSASGGALVRITLPTADAWADPHPNA